MTVSEWADEHRVLDPLFANEGGPWRTSRVPYAREWMDSASCRHVRRITIKASTQVGKTEAMNNVAGYFIHQQPSPAMIVLPRRDDARLAAERRILPMVLASEALRGESTDRAHDMKNREFAFRRCVFYLRAAQSPADLASVPVRLVLGDECDKWPSWTGREANPLSLVMERTRTFYDHVVMLASTPTTRSGLIHREWESGDRRHYWMPCPHCGHAQVFEWRNVRWDSDKITTAEQMREQREAWYRCDRCEKRIDDRDKATMVANGWWVPSGRDAIEWKRSGAAADRHDHRSYHVWAAYSPWVQWWKLVAQFLESKGDPARMMNFVNSWLAELWEERVEDTSDAAVAACVQPDRMMWETPAAVKVVTAAIDVQKDRLEWAVQGWGDDEESWIIAAGKTSSWKELGEILFLSTWGEQQLRLRVCLIDSRFRRDEVLDFARSWNPVVKMVAGVERDTPVPFGTIRIDKHPRTGLILPNAMTIWTVNVGWFKDIVAARMSKAMAEAKDNDSAPNAGRIHLPSDLPEGWLKQLASEHKVKERTGKNERLRWILKPGHARNEAWDLLVYNAAAARLIRVDTLRSPGNIPARPPRPTPPPRPERKRGGGWNSFPKLGG
jgi:phage terminase large subunit GpA-like protein